VSNARLDLPEPESPVITTRRFLGMSRSMFLRLCVRAPRTRIIGGVPASAIGVWRAVDEGCIGI